MSGLAAALCGSAAALLAAVYVLATPLLAQRVLMRFLERFDALPVAALHATRAQAIVVLAGDGRHAAQEFGGLGSPGPLSLERLRYAAFLARGTALPVLLVGGASSPPPPISRRMATSFKDDFGLEPRWVADGSRDTMSNGREAAALLLPLGIERVLVVTHAWHMPRAVFSVRLAGLEPIAAPTAFAGAHGAWRFSWPAVAPRADALRLSALALHEAVGLVAYRLRSGRTGGPQPRRRASSRS